MKKHVFSLLLLSAGLLAGCTLYSPGSSSSHSSETSTTSSTTSDDSTSVGSTSDGDASSGTSSDGTSSTSISSSTSVASSSSTSSSSSASSSSQPSLLTSTSDGSNYGIGSKDPDSSGSNYAARATSINEYQLQAASGTPILKSTGTQKILVIPVTISDYAKNATAANRQRIFQTFFGAPGDTSWESLASYYAKSSFGQLLLQGSVTDWFNCGYSTSTLPNLTNSSSSYDPTWTVLENAVAWYKKTYNTDGREFDNDGDGYLDGVWLVYSAPDAGTVSSLDSNIFWAYTYWDQASDPSPSSPTACTYAWASYDFMNEGYGAQGRDAHTYIHETGHMMGLDDYYVADSIDGTKNYGPMGLIDMMDGNIIDQNAYSKFSFGWIDPFVVSGSTSLTLKPASTSGEAILIPTGGGWNGSAYDEYMLLEYYTPDVLNEADSKTIYPGRVQAFSENGVRIYHVDARLAKATVSGNNMNYAYTDTLSNTATTYTIRAHSNSNNYNVLNQNYRLIQEMDCTLKRNFDAERDTYNKDSYTADNSTLFQGGDVFTFASYQNSFPNYYYNHASTMNDGTSFGYSIAFSAMSSSGITVTINAI